MIRLINASHVVEIDCTLIIIICNSDFNLMNKWVYLCSSLSTLETWNEYLKHNDHKNKIIRQTKCAHFRSQMHELSNALKLIWCFAKWARIESQLSKKLSQFSLLKQDDTDYMITTFEEKIEMLQGKFFSSFSQADVNDISNSYLWQYHQIHASQRIKWSEQSEK